MSGDLDLARVHRAAQRFHDAAAPVRRVFGADFGAMCDALEDVVDAIAAHSGAPPPDRLVGMAEAAEALDLSPTTLRELVRRRAIPVVEMPSGAGHRPIIRFRQSALDAFLSDMTRTA